MELIYGGSGSGKSAYAETLCEDYAGNNKMLYYLATMQAADRESLARIDKHVKRREGKGYQTIEQPTKLEQCFSRIEVGSVVLLECLSNLIANEMFGDAPGCGNPLPDVEELTARIYAGIQQLDAKASHLVVVSNNIYGDGGHYDPLTECYLEVLGRLNIRVAVEASRVTEVVAGIAIPIL